MGYNKRERVQVKKEFLRMLVSMELDPARMYLLNGFFEQYLTLSEEEEIQLNKEIAQLESREAEAIYRFETEKERKGRIEGYRVGKEEGLQQGMQQGMQEGIRQIASRMLSMGKSIDDIIEVTGLTEADIAQLKY